MSLFPKKVEYPFNPVFKKPTVIYFFFSESVLLFSLKNII